MILVQWKSVEIIAISIALLAIGVFLFLSARKAEDGYKVLAAISGGAMIFLALLGSLWWVGIAYFNNDSAATYSRDGMCAARTSTFVPLLGSGTTVVELYSKRGLKKDIAYRGLEQSVGLEDLAWRDDHTLVIKFDPISNDDHECVKVPQIQVICQSK